MLNIELTISNYKKKKKIIIYKYKQTFLENFQVLITYN